MKNIHELEVSVGGKTLTFQTGKVARQANASVTIRCEDTVLLSTVCRAKEPSEGTMDHAIWSMIRYNPEERPTIEELAAKYPAS